MLFASAYLSAYVQINCDKENQKMSLRKSGAKKILSVSLSFSLTSQGGSLLGTDCCHVFPDFLEDISAFFQLKSSCAFFIISLQSSSLTAFSYKTTPRATYFTSTVSITVSFFLCIYSSE